MRAQCLLLQLKYSIHQYFTFFSHVLQSCMWMESVIFISLCCVCTCCEFCVNKVLWASKQFDFLKCRVALFFFFLDLIFPFSWSSLCFLSQLKVMWKIIEVSFEDKALRLFRVSHLMLCESVLMHALCSDHQCLPGMIVWNWRISYKVNPPR